MIAVYKEFGFSFAFAGRDGRGVELVKDAALSLRLRVQSVASARLGKLLESFGGRLTDSEQGVARVVRPTCCVAISVYNFIN